MKRVAIVILSLLVLGVGVFLLGPRLNFDPSPQAVSLPESFAELESVIAADANTPDVVPGAEKRLLWYDEPEATDLAVVYLHGFSASRGETAPFSENLARRLGANLFETRLSGHGLKGDHLGDATAEQWLDDALEAIAIGRRIGTKIVVVGVSTGATLAALAIQRGFSRADDFAAFVLISPNFKVRGSVGQLLELPWASKLLPLAVPRRSWEPENEQHGTFWTTDYRTPVLFEMQRLVKAVRESPTETFTVPTLVLASPKDTVVEFAVTEKLFEQWPSTPKELIRIDVPEGNSTHVIAGDVLNPTLTSVLLDHAETFLKR
ncbi:MAG: alpha/beta fold hydrolase [Myxococcota bacterium]